jgi:hypothetical protein
MDTLYVLHRQALASRKNEELQTILQAVIGVVRCVKNSPLRGRHFANVCNDMEAEHTAFLYLSIYLLTYLLNYSKEQDIL